MDLSSKSIPSIQLLDREISRKVRHQWESHQKPRPGNLHPLNEDSEVRIILPRKFRELRALAISCWYFPEELKYEILLELGKETSSNSKRNFRLSQEIEIAVLSNSLEHCLSYLCSGIISTRVLFGTILQEDLLNALKNLRIIRVRKNEPRRIVRRKGYRDKGFRRPPHRWLPSEDFSLIEHQNRKEKLQTLETLLTHIFLRKLEEEW